MKNMKNKYIFIAAAVIIAIALVIIISVIISHKGNNELTCTKKSTPVSGFQINEHVKFNLSKKGIKKIAIDKKVNISGEYSKHETYTNVIESHFKNAYNYINKDINIKKKNNTISVKFNITEGGVVIDNLNIKLNNPDNILDINVNTENNLDASTSTYKINDKYTKRELKKKIEELGFACK